MTKFFEIQGNSNNIDFEKSSFSNDNQIETYTCNKSINVISRDQEILFEVISQIEDLETKKEYFEKLEDLIIQEPKQKYSTL